MADTDACVTTPLTVHGAGTVVPAGTLLTITTDHREQVHSGVFRLLRDVTQDQIEGLVRIVREGSATGNKDHRVVNRMLDLKIVERVATSQLMIDTSSSRPCLLIP